MFPRHLAITAPFALTLVTAGAAAADAVVATTPGTATATQANATQVTARTHPSPSHFTPGRVDDPWFPLCAGNRLVYRGSDDGHHLRDVFFVYHRTARIDGVVCRVARDRVFRDGILRERTTDWYAQTKTGTVWNFGERTTLLNRHGHVVSRKGSFRSGRDGAEAGNFMPAHPLAGQSFKQENYPGHAEDRLTIVGPHATVSVPVIGSHHAMHTRETTVLEPGVVDHKYYVRDVGTVREVTVRGGNESLRPVSISHLR